MSQTTINRRGACLGSLARDHGRVGNITPDEVARITSRIHQVCRARWGNATTDAEASLELDRIAGELSDI